MSRSPRRATSAESESTEMPVAGAAETLHVDYPPLRLERRSTSLYDQIAVTSIKGDARATR